MTKAITVLRISFLTFLLFSVLTSAQTEDQFVPPVLPEGLNLSNQMKYSFDNQAKREIFENWFNLDYSYGIFNAGIRFESFQPNDPNPAVARGRKRDSGINFKYIRAEIGDIHANAEFTVGNYYALFGRGMLLKIYEDRNLRVDNNLTGIKLNIKYEDLYISVLSGMPENMDLTRSDVLHALDFEYRMKNIANVGLSLVSNRPDADGVATTTLTSARVHHINDNFDVYAEYGLKFNEDIKQNKFKGEENFIGKAFYGNVNFYVSDFSLVTEYKYYDNFQFASFDGSVIYNTPPALRKDYTYLLLNRHPSPLNQANEQGFYGELSYNFDDNTGISLNAGETRTLPVTSLYQRSMNTKNDIRVQFREAFLQANHKFGESFDLFAGFGYNEELDKNTKNITPVAELKYYFDDINTLKFVLEHQSTTDRTTQEKYFTQAFTLEYLRSPLWSVALVSELLTREPMPGHVVRKVWGLLQFGYRLAEHTDMSLLIGSRQAGNICIGGVCRYEPEFRGIEIKMMSRL